MHPNLLKMKKKSSPGRDGSRGSNDRSRPATGRGRAPRNDDRGSRPARSEKKSNWDDFDNGSKRSESGERSSESKRPYQRREESSGEKRPYQRRDDSGGSRRSEFGDRSSESKRPYQRREESSGEKRPYQRRDDSGGSRRSEFGDRSSESKRPYQRREESSGEKRPYQRRDDSGARSEFGDRSTESKRPYQRRDESSGEKRPYQRREGRSEFGDRSSESKRPFQRRGESSERGEGQGQGMYQRREERSEFGERSTERGENSSEGKRPYQRRDESENTEGKRPFKRSEFGERSTESSEGKRPYQRSESGDRSSEGFGDKRPYQRREDSGSEKRPYQRREESSGGFGEKRTYQKRDENSGFGDGGSERRRDSKRPPSREDRHAKFEEKKSFRDRPAYGKSGGRKSSPRKRSASVGPDLSGEIRLNRFIGMAGICSRREADDLITAGVISVNGQVATELGMKVKPGDDVRYNGERIRNEKHVYLLLNKPKDYITTSDDPNDRKTVMELIAGACPERVYPVGRLDRQTTGLLLFTNDGDLAKHLTHPSSRVKKIYQAELDKNFKVADMRQLQEGVELEDGISSVDEISIGNAKDDKKIVGVELHSGKNRVVRRMFESLGYEVVKLDRVGFAGLTKKDLPRGRWRMLDEREVGFLKMMGTGKKKTLVD